MTTLQKGWKTVRIPAVLLKQVERHIAQKDCTSPNKSDFIRGAVERGLRECAH